MFYELEIRFHRPGIVTSGMFVSFLRDHYSSYYTDTIKDTSYVDTSSPTRYIKDSGGVIRSVQKETLETSRTSDYKFTISSEKVSSTAIDEIPKDKSFLVRDRERDVYILPSGLQLHITKVNEVTEVEIELESDVNTREQTRKFKAAFDAFWTTLLPYVKLYSRFLEIFNNRPTKNYEMVNGIISKPRDITKQDFETRMGKDGNIKGIPEGYTLTIKANGTPRLLYLSDSNLFMAEYRKQFKLLSTFYKETKEEFIIIGEHIVLPDKDLFLPFDILHWSRKLDVRNHPDHLERLGYIREIIDRYDAQISPILEIYFKPFVPVGKTPSSFAKARAEVLSIQYPFEDDGLMLTPIYYSHNPFTFRKDEDYKRKLYKYPETCKIKPWNEQSIDLRVDLTKREAYADQQVEPYDKISIDWSTFPPEAHMNITELVPRKDSNDNIIFVYQRLRPDKTEPNFVGNLDRIIKLVYDPLDESFLTTKGMPRLRLQNNRVKRIILDDLPKGSIVIDIGSGQGGDILKFNGRAHTVISIEPWEPYRREFISRLENLKKDIDITTRFISVSGGGEDTEKIIDIFREVRKDLPDAPVAVTSMLSMTFFWKNPGFLERFKGTLRAIAKEIFPKTATFHFFTIDGKRFLEYFQENSNKIESRAIRARYYPDLKKYGVSIPGKVLILIQDSIVGKDSKPQEEYLVNLDDLSDVLSDIKISEGLIETYLTKDESRYGKTHVYGVAKIRF